MHFPSDFRSRHRNLLSGLAALLLVFALAGCGSAKDDAGDVNGESAAGGAHAEHQGGQSGGGDSAGMEDDMAEMVTIATVDEKDLSIEIHAMPPELFYVSEGSGLRPQRPTAESDAHLMVTVSDKISGIRLPDAAVTLRIADANDETAFEGPLYPMVGRGMGLHYGENVELGEPGEYTVTVTVGPPRIGRHRAVADAWDETVKVSETVNFDGKTLSP